jgi:hypothetical protein
MMVFYYIHSQVYALRTRVYEMDMRYSVYEMDIRYSVYEMDIQYSNVPAPTGHVMQLNSSGSTLYSACEQKLPPGHLRHEESLSRLNFLKVPTTNLQR